MRHIKRPSESNAPPLLQRASSRWEGVGHTIVAIPEHISAVALIGSYHVFALNCDLLLNHDCITAGFGRTVNSLCYFNLPEPLYSRPMRTRKGDSSSDGCSNSLLGNLYLDNEEPFQRYNRPWVLETLQALQPTRATSSSFAFILEQSTPRWALLGLSRGCAFDSKCGSSSFQADAFDVLSSGYGARLVTEATTPSEALHHFCSRLEKMIIFSTTGNSQKQNRKHLDVMNDRCAESSATEKRTISLAVAYDAENIHSQLHNHLTLSLLNRMHALTHHEVAKVSFRHRVWYVHLDLRSPIPGSIPKGSLYVSKIGQPVHGLFDPRRAAEHMSSDAGRTLKFLLSDKNEIFRMHYFNPFSNPADDGDYYLSCVQDLAHSLRTEINKDDGLMNFVLVRMDPSYCGLNLRLAREVLLCFDIDAVVYQNVSTSPSLHVPNAGTTESKNEMGTSGCSVDETTMYDSLQSSLDAESCLGLWDWICDCNRMLLSEVPTNQSKAAIHSQKQRSTRIDELLDTDQNGYRFTAVGNRFKWTTESSYSGKSCLGRSPVSATHRDAFVNFLSGQILWIPAFGDVNNVVRKGLPAPSAQYSTFLSTPFYKNCFCIWTRAEPYSTDDQRSLRRFQRSFFDSFRIISTQCSTDLVRKSKRHQHSNAGTNFLGEGHLTRSQREAMHDIWLSQQNLLSWLMQLRSCENLTNLEREWRRKQYSSPLNDAVSSPSTLGLLGHYFRAVMPVMVNVTHLECVFYSTSVLSANTGRRRARCTTEPLTDHATASVAEEFLIDFLGCVVGFAHVRPRRLGPFRRKSLNEELATATMRLPPCLALHEPIPVIGFAIVRNISIKDQTMYLVSACSSNTLREAQFNALILSPSNVPVLCPDEFRSCSSTRTNPSPAVHQWHPDESLHSPLPVFAQNQLPGALEVDSVMGKRHHVSRGSSNSRNSEKRRHRLMTS